MPRVFEAEGYRFFFFSNEGDPLEPCHIHVRKAGGLAKVWIEPVVVLASADGFSSKELRTIERLAGEHRAEIEEAWNEFFN